MEHNFDHQTWRLAQKTASLKILYEAAVNISQVQDPSKLLIQYLRIFREMVNGCSASVHLFTSPGHAALFACIDSHNQIFLKHQLLPIPFCQCGRVLLPGGGLCEQEKFSCSLRCGSPMYSSDKIELLDIPLQCRNKILGNYYIWVKRNIVGREDVRELLTTIGR